MNGISPFDSLLTGSVDALPDLKTQLDILSKENLQNTLALTPNIDTSSALLTEGTPKMNVDLSKLSDTDISKSIMSSVIKNSAAIKYAPISSPYNYAKKYDSSILGFNPTRSYEEQEDMYADYYQSGFAGGLKTAGKGLLSRGLSILPKLAAGFGHVGGAVVDILSDPTSAFQGKFNYAMDNFFVNAMHNADEGLREALPIYADSDYFQGGLWDKVFTGKFLADDMLDGVAYAASSMINVPAIGALGKLGSAAGKSLGALGKLESVAATTSKLGKLAEPVGGFAAKMFSTETALGNTLIKANKALTENAAARYLLAPVEGGASRLASWAKTGGYTAFNTISEAGAEAYDLKKTLIEDLVGQGYSKDDAEKIATARAQETMMGNLIGLSASNLWELKTVFPKMFNSASSDIKSLQKLVRTGALKAEEMSLLKGTLKKLGTGFVMEGLYEENFQTALQQYEKRKALTGGDEEGLLDTLGNVASIMSKNAGAFAKGAFGGYQSLTQEEKEGADSILLGAVIGMGMGAGGNVLENRSTKKALIDYQKTYQEYGQYQHGLFNMLGDDKRNILKSFTKTNPDGTSGKSYLNEKGEYEYDVDNIAKLTLFNLENKKLYNEYMQRVAMGDEAGASFLLDQAFARLSYQAINNKFWQGDRKEAIEDLKLKIKDFQMPEDTEDLGLQEELQKRLGHVDSMLSLHDKIDSELGSVNPSNVKDMIRRNYAQSAMFYEGSKINSLSRLKDKYLEQQQNGDTEATRKIEELDKLIEDARESYRKFANPTSRTQLFDDLENKAQELFDTEQEYNTYNDEINKLEEERNLFLKTLQQGDELKPENKTKIDEYNNKIDENVEKRSLSQYKRHELENKNDYYTNYNRLATLGDPNNVDSYKSHSDILSKFKITREAGIYFNSLQDGKVSKEADEFISSFDLSQVVPLIGNTQEILDKIVSDRTRFNIVITQLDQIRSIITKIRNKQNPTQEDQTRLDELKTIYTTLYNSISAPNMDDVKNEVNDQIIPIIDELNNYIASFADPFTETADFIEEAEDYISDPQYEQADRDTVKDLLDRFKSSLSSSQDLISLLDTITSYTPSNINFNVGQGGQYNGHSFNPQDYKGITIQQYDQIQDQDNWLNRSIMVDEIAASQTIADTFLAKEAADDLSSFDTNPNAIINKLMMLYGIKEIVKQDDRKDNENYEGVAEKVDELIPLLKTALDAARNNTNAREIEQVKYDNYDKSAKFESIGIGINANGNYSILNNELVKLIKDAIGENQFTEILDKAKADTVSQYSQLYYEMILEKIRKSPTPKIEAINNYLLKTKSQIATDLNNKNITLLNLGSDKLDLKITANQINKNFFAEEFSYRLLSQRGIWTYPKLITDYLSDGNFRNLMVQLGTPNVDLTVTHNLNGNTTNLDFQNLVDISELGIALENLNQLRNDLRVDPSYNPTSYYTEQKKLADGNDFSLSQQQRIAEIELTKRFRSTKSDPENNVNDFFFFLNAIAGSGKTSGVGKWFTSKLGLKDEQILVTSHLPKSSEVAAKAMASNQQPTIIFDILEEFKKLDKSAGQTVITVNGQQLDLKNIKLLVIDEIAALGDPSNYTRIVEMITYVNNHNGNNSFKVLGLGDINQLTNDAVGIAHIQKVLTNGSVTSLPRLTISYRSAVTAISDVFSMFKGKSTLVENLSVSASEPIGSDAFGVHVVGPANMQPIDAITKQLNASTGGKLIITTEAKKAAYQSAFPGVTVFTPEEAQSFTEDNVFIDLPIEGDQEVYNKKMYVSISRASKYAMVIDYTNTFKQSEDKNMRSIIDEDRKENDAKILDNRVKYVSLLDHYLNVLGAAPTTTQPVNNQPVPKAPTPGPAPVPVTPAPGAVAPTQPQESPTMTEEQIKEQEFDNLTAQQSADFQTLMQNNQRYFELFKKEYVYGKLDALEESETSALLEEMINNFTPATEKAFDDFCKKIPC